MQVHLSLFYTLLWLYPLLPAIDNSRGSDQRQSHKLITPLIGGVSHRGHLILVEEHDEGSEGEEVLCKYTAFVAEEVV